MKSNSSAVGFMAHKVAQVLGDVRISVRTFCSPRKHFIDYGTVNGSGELDAISNTEVFILCHEVIW